MSITPHASEALACWHVFLWNLFRCTLALAILAGHWIYKKGKRMLQSLRGAEECKGTGVVASVDVFEVGALGWYLKPQSKEVDALGRAKGNRN